MKKSLIFLLCIPVFIMLFLTGCVDTNTKDPVISVVPSTETPIETPTPEISVQPTETPIETPIIEEEVNLQEIAEEICSNTAILIETTEKSVYKKVISNTGKNSSPIQKCIEELTPDQVLIWLEVTRNNEKISDNEFLKLRLFIQVVEELRLYGKNPVKVTQYFFNEDSEIYNLTNEIHEYTDEINSDNKDIQLEGSQKFEDLMNRKYMPIADVDNPIKSMGGATYEQESLATITIGRSIVFAISKGYKNIEKMDTDFDNAKIFEFKLSNGKVEKLNYHKWVNCQVFGEKYLNGIVLTSINNNIQN